MKKGSSITDRAAAMGIRAGASGGVLTMMAAPAAWTRREKARRDRELSVLCERE